MEGVVRKLTDPLDSTMKQLRELATFYVVPLMCPDGAVRGYLRTNFLGTNLNREWGDKKKFPGYEAPTMQRSPEVLCVQEEMKKTGCDVFFDVHGDEEIPDNFFMGPCGMPGWNQTHENKFVYLSGRAKARNKAFQIGRGYGEGGPLYLVENDAPGTASTAYASDSVAARYDCLSVTLEMPFKDVDADPEPEQGWSPARCAQLGASHMLAVFDVLSHLKPDGSMNSEAALECAQIKRENPGLWWGPA